MAARAEIKPERFGFAFFERRFFRTVCGGQLLGDLIQMIDIQIRGRQLIGIEGGERFKLHHESTIIQLATAEIAREMQHGQALPLRNKTRSDIRTSSLP